MRIACFRGRTGWACSRFHEIARSSHDIVVIERNKPDDTFGWGVVLSDETLDNLAANDPFSAEAIRARYWDDIALHYKGETLVSSDTGFAGSGVKTSILLQARRAN